MLHLKCITYGENLNIYGSSYEKKTAKFIETIFGNSSCELVLHLENNNKRFIITWSNDFHVHGYNITTMPP